MEKSLREAYEEPLLIKHQRLVDFIMSGGAKEGAADAKADAGDNDPFKTAKDAADEPGDG